MLTHDTHAKGLCVRSQSFSASSIRVCQPGPVARKAADTLGDRRMVVGTLVGAFCGPRSPLPYTRPARCMEARSMSLMRVCQPSPVARSAASK